MNTSFPATTTNPHIAALEAAFSKATEPVDWLVISHNDSRMLQSLSSALPEPAVVLEVPQHTWDFDNKDLPELIEWASQGKVKNLVLLGHSQGEGPESEASLLASSADHGSGESGYARILAGVQRNTAGTRAIQQRFTGHLKRMLQIPILESRCSSGDVSVYGLFYRAESGLFLLYDADGDTFCPLV